MASPSALKWNENLVPVGFAGGLLTLTPETEIHYDVAEFYSRGDNLGIRWADPDMAIDGSLDVSLPCCQTKTDGNQC